LIFDIVSIENLYLEIFPSRELLLGIFGNRGYGGWVGGSYTNDELILTWDQRS
jgi:hypothetical protein